MSSFCNTVFVIKLVVVVVVNVVGAFLLLSDRVSERERN